VTNIYVNFRSNPSIKCRDIASCEMDANGQQTDGRTADGQPQNMMLSAYYYWYRHKN